MILVIGGAFQGKLEFAAKLAGCDTEEVFTPGEKPVLTGSAAEGFRISSAAENCRILNGLHLLLRSCMERMTEEETDAAMDAFLGRAVRKDPELIIISSEVGYGIVPMDPAERRWREKTGRWMTRIAGECRKVYRVVSGIPVLLKDEDAAVEHPPVRMMFLRHGATPGNALQKYIGRTDEPLSPEGAAKIRPLKCRPRMLAVSPMRRCLQTAALLLGCAPDKVVGTFGAEEIRACLLEKAEEAGISCRIVDDFRECDFGSFENRNYRELSGDPDYQAWIDSGATLPFPGGESRESFRQRTVRAFLSLVNTEVFTQQECRNTDEDEDGSGDGKVILFVVHGGTMMSILSTLAAGREGQKREYFDWHTGNGHGYLLEGRKDEAGRVSLFLLTEV